MCHLGNIKEIKIKKKYVYVTLTNGTVIKHPKNITEISVEFKQVPTARQFYDEGLLSKEEYLDLVNSAY